MTRNKEKHPAVDGNLFTFSQIQTEALTFSDFLRSPEYEPIFVPYTLPRLCFAARRFFAVRRYLQRVFAPTQFASDCLCVPPANLTLLILFFTMIFREHNVSLSNPTNKKNALFVVLSKLLNNTFFRNCFVQTKTRNV